MKADVYNQQTSQGPSGQIDRAWTLTETINCKTVPRRQASNSESWGHNYEYSQSFTLKTLADVTEEAKIANIIDSTGRQLYEGTIFDVSERVAITDGFGRLVEWELTLTRSEVQAFD